MESNNFGTSKTALSNNHIDIFYFSNSLIHKHIDLVKFSSSVNDDEKIIFRIIESIGYKRVKKHKLKKGKYLFKDTYKHDADIAVIDIFHELKSEEEESEDQGLPAFLVSVHDPTKELIDLLSSFCTYLGINLKVSKIELTYDFCDLSGKDIIVLFDFLKSHLLLKNSRSKPSERYLTTFYANQLKRSSKGLKVYLRKDDFNRRLVRLELTLKRQLVKKLNINPSLKTIDSVNPFRYFTFMSLDENKLIDYLEWQSRREHKNDKSRNKFMHDELVERHLENYIHGFLIAPFSLMGKVYKLKSKSGVKNYSRFLVPLKDFTQMFIEETEHKAFLPSKIYLN